MLRYFFEKTNAPGNKYLFTGLRISQGDESYWQHHNKYPVIFVTLKDIKTDNFDLAYHRIETLVANLYSKYSELLESDFLDNRKKRIFKSVLEGEGSYIDVQDALKNLTEYLYAYYNVKPIILIDEYDTPIQASYSHGYYEKMIDFMRGFYSVALKDNQYLHKAVLTGILRVAKENIFSGLNNLEVYTLLQSEYSQYFGFTEQEVDELCKKAAIETKLENIRDWYNGYQIGDSIIYNPWSIVNCVKHGGKLEPYWVNTSDNVLIKDIITNSGRDFKHHFEQLLAGESIKEFIDPNIIFSDLQNSEAAIWTLLLMSGYLKATSCVLTEDQYVCALEIPNKEVMSLYAGMIRKWIFGHKNYQWYNRFLNYLREGDIDAFAAALQEIALDMFSYHDLARKPENFFHGFTMGLIASLRNEYYIISNHESGYGRYDVAMFPKLNAKQPAIIFEFKNATKDTETALKEAACEALNQIDKQRYAAAIQKFHADIIFKVGVAFCGKKIYVAHAKEIPALPQSKNINNTEINN